MNRRMFRTLLLLLILAAPSVMRGEEMPPPDFSRQALLRIFGDFYSNADTWLRQNVSLGSTDFRLQFAPVVLPLLREGAQTDLMPAVSPFELMNVSFPASRDMVAVDDPSVSNAIDEIEARRAKAHKR